MVQVAPGSKAISRAKTTLNGTFYAMLSLDLLKLAKLPLTVIGEILVDTDPNHDGAPLVETIGRFLDGGTMPATTSGTDKDMTVLIEGRLDARVAMKDVHKKLAALGELRFTVGKGVLSIDTRPGRATTGLRIAGKTNTLQWPDKLKFLQPKNEMQADLWIVDEETFGLQVSGEFGLGRG